MITDDYSAKSHLEGIDLDGEVVSIDSEDTFLLFIEQTYARHYYV